MGGHRVHSPSETNAAMNARSASRLEQCVLALLHSVVQLSATQQVDPLQAITKTLYSLRDPTDPDLDRKDESGTGSSESSGDYGPNNDVIIDFGQDSEAESSSWSDRSSHSSSSSSSASSVAEEAEKRHDVGLSSDDAELLNRVSSVTIMSDTSGSTAQPTGDLNAHSENDSNEESDTDSYEVDTSFEVDMQSVPQDYEVVFSSSKDSSIYVDTAEFQHSHEDFTAVPRSNAVSRALSALVDAKWLPQSILQVQLEHTSLHDVQQILQTAIVGREAAVGAGAGNLLQHSSGGPSSFSFDRFSGRSFWERSSVHSNLAKMWSRSHSLDQMSNGAVVAGNHRESLRSLEVVHPLGRLMSDFLPVSIIGHGAFGEVVKCRHRLDSCEYAIKFVSLRKFDPNLSLHLQNGLASVSHYLRSGRAVQGMIREVQLLARLPPHSHIVRYFGSWVEVGDRHASKALRAVVEAYTQQYSRLTLTWGDADSHASTSSALDTSDVSVGSSTTASHSHNATGDKEADDPNGMDVILFIQMELCAPFTLEHYLKIRNDVSLGLGHSKPPQFDAFVKKFYYANHSDANEKMYTEKGKLSASSNLDINVEILRSITDALVHCHHYHIVHRDVKPANIFLGQEDGRVKLGDFGLATSLYANVDGAAPAVKKSPSIEWVDECSAEESVEDQAAVVTASPDAKKTQRRLNMSVGVGTYLYAAPEQLESGSSGSKSTHQRSPRSYDGRSDVYSLGIIATELWSTFATGTERIFTIQDVRQQARASMELRREYPGVADFIDRCVVDDPSKRWTSREALAYILDHLRRPSQPAHAPPPAVRRSSSTASAPSTRTPSTSTKESGTAKQKGNRTGTDSRRSGSGSSAAAATASASHRMMRRPGESPTPRVVELAGSAETTPVSSPVVPPPSFRSKNGDRDTEECGEERGLRDRVE